MEIEVGVSQKKAVDYNSYGVDYRVKFDVTEDNLTNNDLDDYMTKLTDSLNSIVKKNLARCMP